MWYGSVEGLECGNFTERWGKNATVGRRRLVGETAEVSQKPGSFSREKYTTAKKNALFFRVLSALGERSLALFKEVSGLGCVHFHASCTCHMSIRATSFDDPRPSEKDDLTSRTSSVGSTSNWFKIDSTQTVAYIIPTYIRSTCTIQTSNWSKHAANMNAF